MLVSWAKFREDWSSSSDDDDDDEGPSPAKKYEQLGLADSLRRPYDYSDSCQELALILRRAYAKFPKSLQSIIFRDTLSAFRLLSQMDRFAACFCFDTPRGGKPNVELDIGIPAANLLVKAAEAALPKQKKTLASSKFKHSVIAQRRRGKVHQVEGYMDLPQDILLHVFRFLDIRSLVSASSVCWSWNTAAKDNMLWMSHYYIIFGRIDISIGKKSLFSDFVHDIGPNEGKELPINFDWRGAFKRIFTKQSVWRCRPHRAFCIHCESILWLSAITCGTPHRCPGNEKGRLNIKPISANMLRVVFGMPIYFLDIFLSLCVKMQAGLNSPRAWRSHHTPERFLELFPS
ncbi:F-box protein [Platanthera guangdongensis]|uniref:F-box protein n=1 Tax=Platanthera guangdongensis TaxID=2320717 RepID=A0ABR2LDR4_9ASPA